MNPANLPRSDVGGGTLTGAVTVLLLLLQHDAIFEFDAVSGAIAVVFSAAAAWFVPQHKNFVSGIAALVGSVVAYLVGKAVFGVEGDVAAFSYALSGLVVAAAGYAIPARSADGAQPVVEVPAAQAQRIRHPFT
jgi:uncharacterized membrane protein YfcA